MLWVAKVDTHTHPPCTIPIPFALPGEYGLLRSTASHTQSSSLSPYPTIFTIPLPPFPLTSSIPPFSTKVDSLPALLPHPLASLACVSLPTWVPLPEPASSLSSCSPPALLSVLHPHFSCHFLWYALTSGPKALEADSPSMYPGIKVRPPATLY